jgi:hypothetical protein
MTVTDAGAIPEVVEGRRCGVVAPVVGVEAMAAAMNAMADDPGHNRPLPPHRSENTRSDLRRQSFVTPSCAAKAVMQGLVHPANIVGRQSGRQRLDALVLAGQWCSRTTGLQRTGSASVLCGLRQARTVGRRACLLRTRRRES